MIELKCNNCGRTVKVPEMLAEKLQPDSPAGRVFKCPGCGQPLGGAERQNQPQELKCAKCGRIVSDPAEFVRGKGLCSACSQPDSASASVAPVAVQSNGQVQNPVTPGTETAGLTAEQEINDWYKEPWKNQPRRKLQPAAGTGKQTKHAGRETFLYWGLGGAAVIAVIGLIMHFFIFRDTWEDDNRDKAVEMRQEARALVSRGAYEQAMKKYQSLIDLLSSRRLQSSELKDLLVKARTEKTEAQKSLDQMQEAVKQQQERIKKYLDDFKPQELQAAVYADTGKYEKAIEIYDQILDSLQDRPDHTPEILQAISRLSGMRGEVSDKLHAKRKAELEAATQKAKQEEEARIAAEKARLKAEQAKKDEEARIAKLNPATQRISPQNPASQSSTPVAENPVELTRLRQSDIRAMKDSLRTIQDFVAAYRPVQRLNQTNGQVEDLPVLAERVQQAGANVFAPAFEQAPQWTTLTNWRANFTQTASEMLAACQNIQRNLDTVCNLYKTMKVSAKTADSSANLLKQLNDNNSAEFLKLQELLQQALETVKGG